MDFKHKKLIDVVSNPTLQITFRKLVCQIWELIKEEYLQLSEKAIKIFLYFPTIYMYEVK